MASSRPDQVLNLAAAPSPDGRPSSGADVVVDASRQPAPAGEQDLSDEVPSQAADGKFVRSMVDVDATHPWLGRLRVKGRGPAIEAAVAYFLIVGSGTTAATAAAYTPWGSNHAVCIAIFISVIVLGIWGHKRLK